MKTDASLLGSPLSLAAWAIALGSGCAADSPATVPVDPSPGASDVLELTDRCVVATTDFNGGEPEVTYRALEWNAGDRVLTTRRSGSLVFDEDRFELRQTYDEARRLISDESRGRVSSYERDQAGTPTRQTVYSVPPTDDCAPGEPTAACRVLDRVYEYAASYDERRLLESWAVESTLGVAAAPDWLRTYEHDDAGRCSGTELVVTTGDGSSLTSRETLHYDAAGRLSEKRQVEVWRDGEDSWVARIVFEYDENDRLVREEQWGATNLLASDRPDWIRTTAFTDGGGVISETFDYLTDLPNDRVDDGRGVLEWVGHYVETRSPGCQAVDVETQPAPAQACSSDAGRQVRRAGG